MGTVDMTGKTVLPAPIPTTVFTPDHTPHTRLPAAPRRGEGTEGTVWHTERCTDVDECAEQLAAVMMDANENLTVLGVVDGAIDRAEHIYELRCGVAYPYKVSSVTPDRYDVLLAAAAATVFASMGVMRALR